LFYLKKSKQFPMTNFMLTSISPWLSVRNGVSAIAFYKNAFEATEVYHLDGPDNTVVSRLSINGAEFWLSDESSDSPGPLSLGGISVRMILTTTDPDALFSQALKAGASQVFPVAEEHSWRLGRLVDPFGHHWEIGRPLENK
jgi:PhnB protein